MKKIITTIIYSLIVVSLSTLLVFKFVNHRNRVNKSGGVLTTENYNIDKKKNVIYQYQNFDTVKNYLKTGNYDYEVLYFGRPSCHWCSTYTPIVNEAMFEQKDSILYYNPESIAYTVTKEDGTLSNTEEYNLILSWITENSTGAIEKRYIKEAVYDGQSLMRLYVPRYFFIKNGKIVDCFMPLNVLDENGEVVRGETDEEKAIIKQNYIDWLTKNKNYI